MNMLSFRVYTEVSDRSVSKLDFVVLVCRHDDGSLSDCRTPTNPRPVTRSR